MVLSRRTLSRFLLLSAVAALPVLAQEEAPNFYSGYVVEMSAEKISVERSILGQAPETRSFILTSNTKVEGKMKVKSRVTVQFGPSDAGEVALHIIVRAGTGKGSNNF